MPGRRIVRSGADLDHPHLSGSCRGGRACLCFAFAGAALSTLGPAERPFPVIPGRVRSTRTRTPATRIFTILLDSGSPLRGVRHDYPAGLTPRPLSLIHL